MLHNDQGCHILFLFYFSTPKCLGITSPLSMLEPKKADLELSAKLEKSMHPYGVFESELELAKRYSSNTKEFHDL